MRQTRTLLALPFPEGKAMYMERIASIASLLLAATLSAQTTQPPQQPATGPGGSEYTHASMTMTHHGTDLSGGTDVYWLYQPASPVADSAVIIACFHGSGTPPTSVSYGDSIGEYFWVRHLVRKGYVLVYPHSSDETQIINVIKDAIAQVELGTTRLYRNTQNRVRYGVMGNSLGGYNSFRMAATSSASFHPAEAALPIHSPDWADVSTIPVTTKVVQLCGNSDNNTSTNFPNQESIWAKLQYLPCENRTFIQVRNHRSGNGPTIYADHMFPATGVDSAVVAQYNVLDFYGTWKFSEALFDCTFFGTNCDYCFGVGPHVTYMGEWDNGTPYLPVVVLDSACFVSVGPRTQSTAMGAGGQRAPARYSLAGRRIEAGASHKQSTRPALLVGSTGDDRVVVVGTNP